MKISHHDEDLLPRVELSDWRRAHGHSPVWGGGGHYDWARAAETAGNLVLDINPDLLVIVEGLEYAGTLEGARDRPLQLSRQAQWRPLIGPDLRNTEPLLVELNHASAWVYAIKTLEGAFYLPLWHKILDL